MNNTSYSRPVHHLPSLEVFIFMIPLLFDPISTISTVQPQPRDFEIRLIRDRERPDDHTRHYWAHLGSNPSTYFSWWVLTQPLCVCDLAQKLSKVSAPPESPELESWSLR